MAQVSEPSRASCKGWFSFSHQCWLDASRGFGANHIRRFPVFVALLYLNRSLIILLMQLELSFCLVVIHSVPGNLTCRLSALGAIGHNFLRWQIPATML